MSKRDSKKIVRKEQQNNSDNEKVLEEEDGNIFDNENSDKFLKNSKDDEFSFEDDFRDKLLIEKGRNKKIKPIPLPRIDPESIVEFDYKFDSSSNNVPFNDFFSSDMIKRLEETRERSGIRQSELKEICEKYAPHLLNIKYKMDMKNKLLEFVNDRLSDINSIHESVEESENESEDSSSSESEIDYENF